ncbi:hypothetical protein ACRARG_13590 [Pseudooceanicola sp. C21-150M6]|uniref:hypothetical protein n=1 Tax=Pseudooceanicola sp. C21-150M6 TaxID=3434355 RepID=UPI003D7F812B
MTRRILATILAAAVAVTSVNVSTAQADNRDITRIIVGATALAIIGGAIANANNRDNHREPERYHPRPDPNGYHWGRTYQKPIDRRTERPGYDRRNPSHDRVRGTIPRNCLRNVSTRGGWTTGYGLRCAQESVRGTLPSDCVRRNTSAGPRLFYERTCLRRYGFNA